MAIVLAAPLLKMLAIGIAAAAVWLLKQTGSLESAQNIIASLLNDNTIDQDTADNLKIEMSLYIKAVDDAKISLINWEDTIEDVQDTQNEAEDKELENNPASEKDKEAYRKARKEADTLQLQGQARSDELSDVLEDKDADVGDIYTAKVKLETTKDRYIHARDIARGLRKKLDFNDEVKNDVNKNEYYVLKNNNTISDSGILSDNSTVSTDNNIENTYDI